MSDKARIPDRIVTPNVGSDACLYTLTKRYLNYN